MSVGVYNDFLDYGMFNGENYAVEGSIIQFTILDARGTTVLTCLEQQSKRDGHRQKRFTVRFTNCVSETINQPIVQVNKYMQILDTEELELLSETTESHLKEN